MKTRQLLAAVLLVLPLAVSAANSDMRSASRNHDSRETASAANVREFLRAYLAPTPASSLRPTRAAAKPVVSRTKALTVNGLPMQMLLQADADSLKALADRSADGSR